MVIKWRSIVQILKENFYCRHLSFFLPHFDSLTRARISCGLRYHREIRKDVSKVILKGVKNVTLDIDIKTIKRFPFTHKLIEICKKLKITNKNLHVPILVLKINFLLWIKGCFEIVFNFFLWWFYVFCKTGFIFF